MVKNSGTCSKRNGELLESSDHTSNHICLAFTGSLWLQCGSRLSVKQGEQLSAIMRQEMNVWPVIAVEVASMVGSQDI